MHFKHLIQTALHGLTTHKTRSMLTILGIVIGVAAIIIVMALGNGAQALILGEIGGLGADTAVVQPGTEDDFTSGFFAEPLSEEDLEAITDPGNVPNLVASMPEVVVTGNVSYRGETYGATTIGGTAEYFIDTFDVFPERGTTFTQSDVDRNARVALIGHNVKEDLFGTQDAVGETIKIRDERFRVVGTFGPEGSFLFFNLDDLVLIPYTAAQTYLLGTDSYNQINVRADAPENVDKMVFDIERTLRDLHDIAPGEEDDFVVRTQQGLVEQVSVITSTLTAFLAVVVAVSLVVGGIGIMNIMLVSVTERTREIGLRKALGATRQDILRQFLFEAIILTVVGGVIGIIIGTLIALGASLALQQTLVSDWPFVFPWLAVILGVGVSGIVGLIFGLYPASQASRKSPMEALRYE